VSRFKLGQVQAWIGLVGIGLKLGLGPGGPKVGLGANARRLRCRLGAYGPS